MNFYKPHPIAVYIPLLGRLIHTVHIILRDTFILKWVKPVYEESFSWCTAPLQLSPKWVKRIRMGYPQVGTVILALWYKVDVLDVLGVWLYVFSVVYLEH